MGFSLGQFGPDAWTNPRARSYHIRMPHDLYRKASCEEVGCDQWRFGWETVCDEFSSEDGRMVAGLIRSGRTGRDFTEMQDVRGGTILTIFRFAARQRCFQEHRTRPGELLVHQGGRLVYEHASLANLAEDYMQHTGQLAEQQKRG